MISLQPITDSDGKQMKHWLGTIVIIIGIVLLTPQSVFAVQTYQTGSVVFVDDFNDGNFNGWTVISGKWGIDSLKRLYGFESGKLKSGNIAPPGSWANYRVEIDVQNDNGVDEGINFRYLNDANTYALNLRHRVNTLGTDTPEIKIFKAVGGTTTTIASTHNITLEHYITYKIKIEIVGTHIQIWLDQNLIFDFDDPNTPLQTGGIALSYWTGTNGVINVRFDNIKVTALSPTPKTPVIFIPGIGGSELKLNTATNWSQDNGHGGTFSHAYLPNENIWLNESEAAKPGDDDYFDILRMKPDGLDSEADISVGNLLPQGYPNIDSYFTGLGYIKNVDYFLFPYDWRKDVISNNSALSSIINTAFQTSGKSKVNILAHSLGGLLARSYINEGTNSAKINKLIELGTPHLGSVESLKTIIYGIPVGVPFLKFFNIGINGDEIKDLSQNYPSTAQLIPSKKYYDFQPPSLAWAFYPFSDERDIDLNGETGILDYTHLKTLLSNIGINMPVYKLGENLHDDLDNKYSTLTGVPVYLCVGNGFPTLGQIRETYYLTWPTNLFPKTDQIYINGDDTVPNSSAALKNSLLDLSGGATIYYSNQRHSDLANPSGSCMIQASNWLKDTPSNTPDSAPTTLEGTQVSIDADAVVELIDPLGRTSKINDNQQIELSIPGTLLDKISHTTIAFVNKSSGPVKAIFRPSDNKTANLTIRNYQHDTITKTSIYRNISIDQPTSLTINPDNSNPQLTIGALNVSETSSATGSAVLDNTPPVTSATIDGTSTSNGAYQTPITITLTANDASGSGIFQTRYSIETTSTPSAYLQPITFSNPGTYTLYYGSTDNLGNDEPTKTLTITLNTPPSTSNSTNSGGSTSASNSTSNSNNPTTNPSSNNTPPPNPIVSTIQNTLNPILPKITTDYNELKAVLGTNTITIHLDWLECLKLFYRNQLKLFGISE